jgi:hypothetical protein
MGYNRFKQKNSPLAGIASQGCARDVDDVQSTFESLPTKFHQGEIILSCSEYVKKSEPRHAEPATLRIRADAHRAREGLMPWASPDIVAARNLHGSPLSVSFG